MKSNLRYANSPTAGWRNVGARSCVWWDSLQDLYGIHIYAHPDYATRVEWSDGYVEEL